MQGMLTVRWLMLFCFSALPSEQGGVLYFPVRPVAGRFGWNMLNEVYVVRLAFRAHLFGPDAGLYLSDMRFTQIEHT